MVEILDKMNYLILGTAILYGGGTIFEISRGNFKMATLYTAYAIASTILSITK